MRRLLLFVPLFAVAVVGCGPSGPTQQNASPPSNAYTNMPQQPKPADGSGDGTKKPDGEGPKKPDGK